MTSTDKHQDLLPGLSDDLIALLDRLYPHRCIGPEDTLQDAHRYAGARQLVDELIAWRDETREIEIERGKPEAVEDTDRAEPVERSGFSHTS